MLPPYAAAGDTGPPRGVRGLELPLLDVDPPLLPLLACFCSDWDVFNKAVARAAC